MTFPKRPSTKPPPAVIGGSVRPSNVRDAMTEAHAIAGGALGRPVTQSSMVPSNVRKTILIVDPDDAHRAKLRASLEAYYDIVEAKDGMEAAEMSAKIAAPAMIVSEITMPRVDGFTLAKILKNNPVMKRVPIMFVTARNTPQDVTQALVIGVTQFVPKTTPVPQIVGKIRKIII